MLIQKNNTNCKICVCRDSTPSIPWLAVLVRTERDEAPLVIFAFQLTTRAFELLISITVSFFWHSSHSTIWLWMIMSLILTSSVWTIASVVWTKTRRKTKLIRNLCWELCRQNFSLHSLRHLSKTQVLQHTVYDTLRSFNYIRLGPLIMFSFQKDYFISF